MVNTDIKDWIAAPDLLTDRIILITGAGSGIGRATATAFARHGATVILLGRTVRKLESVYDEIEDAGGPQAAIYPLDLCGATPQDYENLAVTIRKEFGRLDGLLHNAALLGALAPLTHFDTELWFQSIQVNLTAPFLLTRACLELLVQSGDASNVFTSDETGRQGRAYWGAYGIAKAGVECMMQILADETETNTRIRVNSIDPGPVRSALRTLAYPGENPGKLPLPDAVVPVYLYLMGPDSRGVTGQQFDARAFPG